ncbi:DUF6318 family protein [Arthrobacter oryzae]|uniref:DUF6318 family protein n=1 Tax=Arthrobacter oryzae TaxID=409290 RepID=UPI0027D7D7A0|nr:DUF6318 family protein [Arthrobacter oryzae]
MAASALALAACNGGGNPPGTDPTSASASASESASVTPTPTPSAAYKPADAKGKAQNVPVPVLPEAAKTETKEGLEAFADYWFKLLDYAYETGDISGLGAVTSPACELCSNITTSLSTNYEGDRWLAGGKLVTPSITTTFTPESDGSYQVLVQVQQAAISYFAPGGSQFRSPTPPSDTGNVLLVEFKDRGWYLSGLHPIR